ncbi:MAG: hypothetical protein RJA07_1525 [Bacteroidota bacterium]
MKKTFLLFAFAAITIFSNKIMAQMVGQPTTFNFHKMDCNGTMRNCFADLDSGKIVILHLHHSCSMCPPPAQTMQAMANHILANHPHSIKAYAYPTDDLLSCSGSQTWVMSNNVMMYAPMDSGALITAYYGTGMPKVIVLAGKDHRIMYNSAAFSTSDTTIIRDSILNRLGGTTGFADVVNPISKFNVYPNPSNSSTTISINLTTTSFVAANLFDVAGKQVATVLDEKNATGNISKTFSTANLPNGIYLLKVNANGIISEQKLTVAH